MRRFEEVAAAAFQIPESEVRDTLTAKDIPSWDSMNYLLFVADLEREFGVSLTMDDVMNATCLGDLHKLVEERRKQ